MTRLLAAVLVLAVAGTGALAMPVDGVHGTGGIAGDYPPEARTGLMDAWNDEMPHDTGYSYGANCFGWRYVPSQTYLLERIEFYAGGLAGTTTVQVREDEGTNHATGPILGEVTYNQAAPMAWQGENLDPPVMVTEGVAVYIKKYVVVDSNCSMALGGTIIPHGWSWDCISWEGPSSSFYWMARFYGTDDPTPAEASSWGRIKGLYK